MITLTIFLAALIAIVYAATSQFFYQLVSPRSIPCFEFWIRLAVVFVSVITVLLNNKPALQRQQTPVGCSMLKDDGCIMSLLTVGFSAFLSGKIMIHLGNIS
jgi:hypothetical protein